MIDFNAIDEKWQKVWDDAKIFESVPNDKPAYMVTAAFPYVNAPLHIGHIRTYSTADILARYKRMQGFNVLFPFGFHATGIPILSFAKRMQKKDKDLIEEFKVFGIPETEMEKMTDPLYIANYFKEDVEKGMRACGNSIDWRRKFISIEPFFSKYVEWQFGILNQRGYLVQGKHPVGWCQNENNAVGSHDTKHDVEPEFEKQISIKFKLENEDAYLPCTTYRPETIFGVTNVFVKKDATYSLCKINNEQFYLAKSAVEILKNQFEIEPIKEISASELLTKKCVNPITDESIPVLPGFFVKGDVGTGVVMGVPAHAPFDYTAIERLKMEHYEMPEITPKKVIEVEIGKSLSNDSKEEAAKPQHTELPALAYLEVLRTDINAMDDLLEYATKLQYREESHWGKMIVQGYEGMPEPVAREKIREELVQSGNAFETYVMTNAPVYCRCGTEVVVKIVDNQWFLNYGDKNWKEQVKTMMPEVNLLPEKSRNAFNAAIDWIDLRAVARAQGLGTKFPIDEKYIIESLSDSTIYMAFYTIVPYIRDLPVENLKPEFFDFVMLNKGDIETVANSTGIDPQIIKRSKESFEYFYPQTSRHSGPDLIFNHLTMYIFNHVAVFDKKYWPKQLVTNGFVLSEGEKMSKSLGNIVPLHDGTRKYGADPLRYVIAGSADLSSDSEFTVQGVNGVRERLSYITELTDRVEEFKYGELKHIDFWLYSKLQRKVQIVTDALEKLELRTASTELLYASVIELKKYFDRGGNNSIVLKDYLQTLSLILQPFTPHVAEEMWHRLGNNSLVSQARWPVVDKSLINPKIEAEDELLAEFYKDAKNAIALVTKKSGKPAKFIRLVIASEWKHVLTNLLVETKSMSKTMEDAKEIKNIDMEQASKYLSKLMKSLNTLKPSDLTQEEEVEAFNEASDYLAKQVDVEKIEISKEEDSKSQRAARAAPGKPSIEVVT